MTVADPTVLDWRVAYFEARLAFSDRPTARISTREQLVPWGVAVTVSEDFGDEAVVACYVVRAHLLGDRGACRARARRARGVWRCRVESLHG